eukprot:scaffold2366_cov122-Skeletonema_dohrnii-CCMP3373.AAC.20
MMSNSNNRSPIMMNIKGNSPIKKISKAARRGTKLAASAAHKGSQFYEQVQTRMAEVDNKEKSPSRHHHSSAASSSDMTSSAHRTRVRDQINRFNSVAVPSRRSNDGSNDTKEHRHHHEVTTTTRRQHRQQQPDDSKRLIEYADSNETPSLNPNYYEKENESNLPAAVDTTAPYSFTSKDGVRVLSPAMHRQRRKSPKKTSASSSSPQKAASSLSSSPKKATSSSQSNLPPPPESNIEACDETEMLKKQLRALEKDNEKLMKRNSRLERKCDKLARDNTQLIEEVDVVQAAGNNGGNISTANMAHQKGNSNSQGHNTSYGVHQEPNKRDPEDHPLIGSPLRKHMKLVHDSAESNCTVTMRKAPFPLLPPEQTRAIMEARMKEMKEEEDGQHLGMLGNVCGTPSLDVDASFALSYKKRRGKRTKDGEGDSSEEEEAVDLLTSAAFMFKTSRRNLL